MKFRVLATACVAASVVLVAAGAAQVPGQPHRAPAVNNTARFGTNAGGFQRQLATEALERQRDGHDLPGERATLIERVWPLVAEGRCGAAREMVRNEGDRALARRISQVCVEGRPTTLPAQ